MTTTLQEALYIKLASYVCDASLFRRGSNTYIAIGIAEGKSEKNVNAISIKDDGSVSFFTRDMELLKRMAIPYVSLKDLQRPPSKPFAPRDEDGYNFPNLTIELIEAHDEDFRTLVQESIQIVTKRYSGK
jgi:hypothetical protein